MKGTRIHRGRFCATESSEGIALCQWLALVHPDAFRRFYHIANERSSAAQAARLKAEGVKAGVHDYHLALARGAYHGLYVELKAHDGRESAEQKAWQTQALGDGYFAAFAWTWEAAARVISAYLALPASGTMPDALLRVRR